MGSPATRIGSILGLAAGLLLGVSPLALAASESPSDGVYADHIDWGVIIDLSGPTSASQGIWTNGLRDYARKVNESGGINGRKLNLLVEDERFDAQLDRIAFEKLTAQTPVLGISGMGNASAQVALATTIRRGKVPVLGSYTTTKAVTEPPTPMFYGGFCGYKEMAQVGVGSLTDRLKLTAPKVVTIHLDTAGGKEYADFVNAAATKLGGSAKAVPIKANAADATAQVLEIIATKPDFVAIHGTSTTPVLVMRAMQQYGLATPVFGMAYIGTPVVYNSLPPEAGEHYSFVSCFTPGGADESAGMKDMIASTEKFGRGAMKDDLNYVAGWVIGQLVTEAIAKAGPDVTREKLVAMLNKGFAIDTKGLSAPVSYTSEDHSGIVYLKPFAFDYATKRFTTTGTYEDARKYVQ